MSETRVIVITGLPASGKTTLARELAARWRLPLIAKDLIKEPLLDVLGAVDVAQSRRLSDASFAVLFGIAGELVSAGVSCLLEGNFRPGEHETPLMRVLGLPSGGPRQTLMVADAGAANVRVAQVLCRVPEPERRARLLARAADPARHAGHRQGELASAQAGVENSAWPSGDDFLALPSERFVHPEPGGRPVYVTLRDWMNLRAPSL